MYKKYLASNPSRVSVVFYGCIRWTTDMWVRVWVIWFKGISNIVRYLMPSPVSTHDFLPNSLLLIFFIESELIFILYVKFFIISIKTLGKDWIVLFDQVTAIFIISIKFFIISIKTLSNDWTVLFDQSNAILIIAIKFFIISIKTLCKDWTVLFDPGTAIFIVSIKSFIISIKKPL